MKRGIMHESMVSDLQQSRVVGVRNLMIRDCNSEER